jgi:UDP-glucose 4-epimerase
MKYLIIGGTGSLGKKLIDRLTVEGHQLFVCSRDESKHWSIRNDLRNRKIKNVEFIVGDVRDYNRVLEVLNQKVPQIVIIAAALKHIDVCEANPFESIATNLTGTQNVVRAVNACKHPPQRVLFVSTDKAAAASNVYGMCKALSERLVTSQKYSSVASNTGTRWLCTRYGNVLESRGSIIPLFKYQAENAQMITVTDPEMTRFVMTLDESVDLIKATIDRGENGDTWIPTLPAMKIGDIAEIFSDLSGKSIQIIGSRPGEKKHEDLICSTESVRTYRTNDGTYYVVKAALEEGTSSPWTYSSNVDVLSKDELFTKLKGLGIIDASLSSFVGRSIEEIRT